MTEADEVVKRLANTMASVLAPEAIGLGCYWWSMDHCRDFVRDRMPDESVQVIDNVAEALFHKWAKRPTTGPLSKPE